MKNNLSDKTVLVYDLGIFCYIAERLARDFKKVYYFCPWASAFPRSELAIVGTGFYNVERILNFWDYVDKADLIVFPDTHSGDMCQYLKNKGYPVAGGGQAEKLELNRWLGRQVQKSLGLPSQKTERIIGLEKLDAYLQKHEDKYVKLNIFRGTIESFFHKDYASTEPLLTHLKNELGPRADSVEFVVEEKIDGIEPGTDVIVWEDEILGDVLLGYEMKSAGYICKVVPMEEIPKPIREVNEKLGIAFKKMGTRFFFSTEVRMSNKDKAYLIDPTLRFAAPGTSSIQSEIIENFSEVIWGLGYGQKVIPKYSHKYGAAVAVTSEWADKHWTKVNFDPADKQWIKFRMGAKFNGDYYCVPGFGSLCVVVGLGNTPEEACKLVGDRMEKVNAYQAEKDTSGLDAIMADIEKGRKEYGIKF